MNSQRFNLLLISAILLTLPVLWMHRFFPSKHLVIFEDLYPHSLIYGSKLPDGTDAAYWVNERERHWQCNSHQRPANSQFLCSYIMSLSSFGVDLSGYTHMLLDIHYQGGSKKIRFYARNYHPNYSKANDYNSEKFNAINLDTSDLVGVTRIPLSDFQVADWWLLQYNIPREDSKPDLRNTTSIAIDFDSNVALGIHDIKVNRIEFVGEWISRERWYLSILFAWLSGIFLYALNQLRLFRLQRLEDNRRIYHLSQQNETLVEESNKFRHLSTVDKLTQVFNRFGIEQIINNLSVQPQKVDYPHYAIILVDIDHFKRINDRRGHDAGDIVLVQISSIIQQRIRRSDFIGRWGGEEFLIVLPDTHKQFALAIAEKIRLVIQDTMFEKDNPIQVTASFGITEKIDNEDFMTTFKRVDKALYAAKNQGRNCCILAEEETP